MLVYLFALAISGPSSTNYREKDRKNIRLVFDYSNPEKKTDPYQCSNVSQVISWKYGNFTCYDGDIITSEKDTIIRSVVTKAKNYIESLIRINRNDHNFSLINDDSEKIFPSLSSFNQDLYISINYRVFNFSTIVIGKSLSYSTDDSRPIQGSLSFNVQNVPSSSNQKPEVDLLYYNVIKQLIVILGMDYNVFKKWMNRETGQPWGESFPLTKYSNPQYPTIPFYILHTPMAHKYSSERFNKKEYATSVPMGIELEVGNNGECVANANSRVYFTELLSGTMAPPILITDLTMTILEDMGWYSTNYSQAVPLPWGRGESIGEERLPSFPNGRPQIDYPSHYLCRKGDFNRTTTCSYDHSSIAFCWDLFNHEVKCPGAPGSDDERFCKAQNFFNPQGYNRRGSNFNEAYSLMKASVLQANCLRNDYEKDPVIINFSMKFGQESSCIETFDAVGEEFDNFSGCYSTQCDSTNTILTVQIEEQLIKCTTPGVIMNITHPHVKSIVCPDPKIVCNAKKYLKTVFSEPERIEMPGDRSYRHKIYALFGFIGFVLIGIGIFIFLKRKSSSEYKEFSKV